MEQERPDELISAYFDSEVTPDERAAVERRLAESEVVRDELAEVGGLSKLLAALPRGSAPPEFRSGVLQAAEQRLLLPARSRQGGVVREMSRRRRVWQGAAALCAIAAALVLTVLAVDHFGGSRVRQENAVASRAPEIGRSISLPDPVNAEPAMRNEELSRLDLDEAAAPETAPAKAAEPSGLARSSGLHRSAEPRYKIDLEKLRDLDIGDAIQVMDPSNLNVIILTVVDRRQGLSDLQLILTANGVTPEPPAVSESLKGGDAEAENDFIVLFVEAGNQQLASALKVVGENETFDGLEVDEPMAFAQLDKRVQTQIINGRMRGELRLKEAAKGGDELVASAPTAVQKPAEEPSVEIADSAPKRSQLPVASPAAESGAVLGQQVQIPAPDEIRSRVALKRSSETRDSSADTLAGAPAARAPSASGRRDSDRFKGQAQVDAPHPLAPVDQAEPRESPALSQQRPESLFGKKPGSVEARPLQVLFVLMGER